MKPLAAYLFVLFRDFPDCVGEVEVGLHVCTFLNYVLKILLPTHDFASTDSVGGLSGLCALWRREQGRDQVHGAVAGNHVIFGHNDTAPWLLSMRSKLGIGRRIKH